MSTFHKRLGATAADSMGGGSSTNSSTGGGGVTPCFLAIVLTVTLEDPDPLNIGKITYKNIASQAYGSFKDDKVVEYPAYPLDRSNIKIPHPGDQVMIYPAGSEIETTQNKKAKAYYTNVISTGGSITYNSTPFIGSNRRTADSSVTTELAPERFKLGLTEPDKVAGADGQIKHFTQLIPFEGDVIYQGRFGGSLRFGSSGKKTPWKDGVPGDPIIVLSADRKNYPSLRQSFVVEDIDLDDSSVYIGSSQNIPVQLSTPTNMLSWESGSQTLDILNVDKKSINNFKGSQIVLNSDRLVLNTKKDFIVIAGGKGVSISSLKNVKIDCDEELVVAPKVGFFIGPGKAKDPQNTSGHPGYDPMVLGGQLKSILDDLIDVIKNMKILFSVNGSTLKSSTKNELEKIKARIPQILSTYSYLSNTQKEAADTISPPLANALPDAQGVAGITSEPTDGGLATNTITNPTSVIPPPAAGAAAPQTFGETTNLYNDPII